LPFWTAAKRFILAGLTRRNTFENSFNNEKFKAMFPFENCDKKKQDSNAARGKSV
jgi:hypothetical protein